MRKNSSSPNRLMESIHLKRFADEGSRQAAAAAEAAAAAAAAHAAGRSAFRGELKDKMATGRHEKATQLQRDEAVHAAILRHQVTLTPLPQLVPTLSKTPSRSCCTWHAAASKHTRTCVFLCVAVLTISMRGVCGTLSCRMMLSARSCVWRWRWLSSAHTGSRTSAGRRQWTQQRALTPLR